MGVGQGIIWAGSLLLLRYIELARDTHVTQIF